MKVGLVGIGKLGRAMMEHWSFKGRAVGIYHPERTKVETFIQHYPSGYILNEKELSTLDMIILALPAQEIVPFLNECMDKGIPLTETRIINMATTLYTKEVKSQFPHLSIWGMKFMGHARDLLERGDGLFITESPLPAEITEVFHDLGRIKIDSEEKLLQVNKLATYYAVKAALELESHFTEQGLAADYIERALRSLAPEVMRSYSEGKLGHFGKEIVRELKTDRISK
ncbi:NAD(P)-binding domain-containing protein [Pseudobacillus wudalianchiensis]|uniref:6-phosphogluconate dehydrogenase NADP-binding domain-containing protein n=1 Tax=Pseudobacillus wudalianchiensis TaxID=1743143 RepID=A0A1B9AU21_9BACI|nr:NAD(P)-binding domain-containing protein [Bacillus wudalianchiensis]OCA87188.1 hypothetical protein A8F95_07960 [Bacillus wudalianchiensis]